MTGRDNTRSDQARYSRADFSGCFTGQPAGTEPTLDLARGRRARRVRTRRRSAFVALAVTAVVVVAATSWGGHPQLAVPTDHPVDQGLPSWPGCKAAGAFTPTPDFVPPPEPSRAAVPSGFTAVQVRRCIQDIRKAGNGDRVRVHVEQEAPVTPALMAYLDQPSVTAGRHEKVLCRANLVHLPWLVLLDQDDHYAAPSIPTDQCHAPLDHDRPGGAPYDVLKYHDISVDQAEVVESRAAREAGCPMGHKNMLVYQPAGGFTPKVDPNIFGGKTVRRCNYTADPVDPGSGTFTSGEPITTRQSAALLRAAATVTAAGAINCTTAATRFTVLASTDRQTRVYIEADGCHRILYQ